MQKHQRATDWTRPVPPHDKTRLCPLSQAPSGIEQPEPKDFSAQGGRGSLSPRTGHPRGQLCCPPSPLKPLLPACSLSTLRVLQHWGWWLSPSGAVSQGPFTAPLPRGLALRAPRQLLSASPLAFVRVNDGLCNQDGNEQQVKLICKDAEATLLFNFVPFFPL